MKAVKAVTDFRYVRFHAILHDEVGVYNEDEHGEPVYNFADVDQIYAGLLKQGVRPVVEISFMPKKLSFNPDAIHPFCLIARFGIDEVAEWMGQRPPPPSGFRTS